ncbi:FAD-dependent 2-octaprenylphenol hydroxylase [soil metagenome]
MEQTTYHFDIIIIGAGTVGLTFACILAQQDPKLRMALLDARPLNNAAPVNDYDTRVSAISRSSQQLFMSLGVWPHILTQRYSPYREMQVWDSNGDGSIHFSSRDIGEADLGHIIEHQVLNFALLQQLQTYPSIQIFAPAQSKILWQNKDILRIDLTNGESLTAKLIVGADGANSWVRQQADIPSYAWDYQQAAVVATVHTELPHCHTAWQRFLTTGPLAFLPLNDPHACSIVWSTSPQHAIELCALPAEKFQQQLAIAFEYRLGKITAVGPRQHFALKMHHAKNYVKAGLALIGDALHTIHPLAGQGVNLGLLDAAWLAEVILTAAHKKRSIGGLHTLRRYERMRKTHNWETILAMEGFKQLFTNELPPVIWLRNMGLKLTDQLVPVKQLCMYKALGVMEEMPTFMQTCRLV